MKNHYKILGVAFNASSDDIKAAYKRLVFRYHPDRNGGDNRFHELVIKINEAYSVLINPARRVAYDSQLYSQATAKHYYNYTRNADNSNPQYSEKKESRWRFTSPIVLAIWFSLSFLGKMANNYINQRDNQTVPIVQESGSTNLSIQEIFSPKTSNQVFPPHEINRIYDSLNPHY